LAQKIREVIPDARMFFLTSSAMYTHHDFVPYLRGSLVASTYPLLLANQRWTASPGEEGKPIPRFAFPNDYSEGVYNATVAHLAGLELDPTPNLSTSRISRLKGGRAWKT
ncbi:MAG: hypothetical protein JO034_14645, partial [Singulisphaera sp.]|nr:hypothetical protein [Singulisphaera sp.]